MATPNLVEPQADPTLWDNEFDNIRAIPSSVRAAAAKPLRLFADILDFGRFRHVLDAGCGNGRNAIWLAEKGCRVFALDFASAAVRLTKQASERNCVADRIHLCKCSLEEQLPLRNQLFDFTLDSYVFCHFLDPRLAKSYSQELWRVTKPGGIVFSSVFSPEDEYYKDLICGSTTTGPLAGDPSNGIVKQLYDDDVFRSMFLSRFNELYFVRFEFTDAVLGKSYKRVILVLVAQRSMNIHARAR